MYTSPISQGPSLGAGISEDDSWRACPIGYQYNPDLDLANGPGFEQSMNTLDFQPGNVHQPASSTPASQQNLLPPIAPNRNLGAIRRQGTDRIPGMMSGMGSDTDIPPPLPPRPSPQFQQQLPDDVQHQINEHRAANQAENERSNRPDGAFNITNLRRDENLASGVNNYMQTVIQPRIPSLTSAPNAQTDEVDQHVGTQDRHAPRQANGAYNYNYDQLHQVTGDGIRVTGIAGQPNNQFYETHDHHSPAHQDDGYQHINHDHNIHRHVPVIRPSVVQPGVSQQNHLPPVDERPSTHHNMHPPRCVQYSDQDQHPVYPGGRGGQQQYHSGQAQQYQSGPSQLHHAGQGQYSAEPGLHPAGQGHYSAGQGQYPTGQRQYTAGQGQYSAGHGQYSAGQHQQYNGQVRLGQPSSPLQQQSRASQFSQKPMLPRQTPTSPLDTRYCYERMIDGSGNTILVRTPLHQSPQLPVRQPVVQATPYPQQQQQFLPRQQPSQAQYRTEIRFSPTTGRQIEVQIPVYNVSPTRTVPSRQYYRDELRYDTHTGVPYYVQVLVQSASPQQPHQQLPVPSSCYTAQASSR